MNFDAIYDAVKAYADAAKKSGFADEHADDYAYCAGALHRQLVVAISRLPAHEQALALKDMQREAAGFRVFKRRSAQ